MQEDGRRATGMEERERADGRVARRTDPPTTSNQKEQEMEGEREDTLMEELTRDTDDCGVPLAQIVTSRQVLESMISAAEPVLHLCDSGRSIARGLLVSEGGEAFETHLTYDATTGLIAMAVRLGRVSSMTEQQRDMLMSVQQTACLTRVDYDREDKTVWLRAASVCPCPLGAPAVVRRLLEEVPGILADDRLLAVLSR